MVMVRVVVVMVVMVVMVVAIIIVVVLMMLLTCLVEKNQEAKWGEKELGQEEENNDQWMDL